MNWPAPAKILLCCSKLNQQQTCLNRKDKYFTHAEISLLQTVSRVLWLAWTSLLRCKKDGFLSFQPTYHQSWLVKSENHPIHAKGWFFCQHISSEAVNGQMCKTSVSKDYLNTKCTNIFQGSGIRALLPNMYLASWMDFHYTPDLCVTDWE